jgi:hypothetical protein
MSKTDKVQADVAKMANKIAEELMAAQVKFQDER